MAEYDANLIRINAAGLYQLLPIDSKDSLDSEVAACLNLPTKNTFNLSYLLKNHRDHLELTLEQLSNLTGINRQQLWRIEAGKLKEKPHSITLDELSKVFGDKFKLGLRILGLSEK